MGMVLGDGSLSVRQRLKDGKYPYTAAELTLKHSIVQREYMDHKAAMLNRMFGGNATVREFSVTVSGKVHQQCRLSKSHKYFRALHRVTHPGGTYKITRRLLDYLTPHGIAVWYMDDGSARVNRSEKGWVTSCSTDISTCCSYDEAVEVQLYFQRAHDIAVKVFRAKPGKDYYSIRMNTAESQKFARLISEWVIPHMRYKLAHVADLNVHECRTLAKTCVVCGKLSYNIDRKRGMCGACYAKDRYAARKAGDDIVRPNGTTTV